MSHFKLEDFYLKKQALKQEVSQIEEGFKQLSGKKKLGLASMLVSNLAINKSSQKLDDTERLAQNTPPKINVDLFDNVYSLLLVPFLKKYTVNSIQNDKLKNKFIGYALLYGLPILLKQFNAYMESKAEKRS